MSSEVDSILTAQHSSQASVRDSSYGDLIFSGRRSSKRGICDNIDLIDSFALFMGL